MPECIIDRALRKPIMMSVLWNSVWWCGRSRLQAILYVLTVCVAVLWLGCPGVAGRKGGRWTEGDLRLSGGKFWSQGSVLIYNAGRWGTVCDDGWNDVNSDVVCRQQGFPGSARPALKMEFGGRGRRRVWMTRVRCQGREQRLLDCDFQGWNQDVHHLCRGQWRAAGVVCKPKVQSVKPQAMTDPAHLPELQQEAQQRRHQSHSKEEHKAKLKKPRRNGTNPAARKQGKNPTVQVSSTPNERGRLPAASLGDRPATMSLAISSPQLLVTSTHKQHKRPDSLLSKLAVNNSHPNNVKTYLTLSNIVYVQSVPPTLNTMLRKSDGFSFQKSKPSPPQTFVDKTYFPLTTTKKVDNTLNVNKMTDLTRSAVTLTQPSTTYLINITVRTLLPATSTTAKPTSFYNIHRTISILKSSPSAQHQNTRLATSKESTAPVAQTSTTRPSQSTNMAAVSLMPTTTMVVLTAQQANSVSRTTITAETQTIPTTISPAFQILKSAEKVVDLSKVKSSTELSLNGGAFKSDGGILLQADSPSSPTLELQLVGGRYSWEGRLQVREVNGQTGPWATVCGAHWGMRETMVVCRELGLNFAKQNLQTNYFGGQEMSKAFYSFNCTGRESKLSDCRHTKTDSAHICPKATLVAGVVCSTYLPDLVPNLRELQDSVRLQDRPLYYLQCALEENCLSSSAYAIRNTSYWRNAQRRLLRFSTVVHNRGNADFRPYINKGQWQWHTCHMHFHSMEVFAHYDILDENGTRLAEGSKASFCLEDTTCDRGVTRQFLCAGFGDQGLSVNCSDNYLWDIDCQWIDITDIKPGRYTFLLEVNPTMMVAELDFDNNVARCDLWYSSYAATLTNCRHESLLGYRIY